MAAIPIPKEEEKRENSNLYEKRKIEDQKKTQGTTEDVTHAFISLVPL